MSFRVAFMFDAAPRLLTLPPVVGTALLAGLAGPAADRLRATLVESAIVRMAARS